MRLWHAHKYFVLADANNHGTNTIINILSIFGRFLRMRLVIMLRAVQISSTFFFFCHRLGNELDVRSAVVKRTHSIFIGNTLRPKFGHTLRCPISDLCTCSNVRHLAEHELHANESFWCNKITVKMRCANRKWSCFSLGLNIFRWFVLIHIFIIYMQITEPDHRLYRCYF